MHGLTPTTSRILIVDDNRAIHDDFRKILQPDSQDAKDFELAESALFGAPVAKNKTMQFELNSAYQGKEALELVRKSVAEKKPFAMAFMDVRMPPGWDGIETTAAIWKLDPDIQIVICTAYSDYSWNDLHAKLGHTDRLVILKKPFDNIEVLQLAHALSEKWRLLQQTRRQVFELEERVDQRTAQLQETNRRLETEIAERKQAEFALRESQHMVLRQERLAAVGQLSAGVAHDFNNIMTVIHGHASLLLLGKKVLIAAHEPLREIEKAAMRAAKLTQQLLAFSRKQAMQPRPVNLGEIAGGMAAMLERAIGEHIRLRVTAMPNSPAVHADVSMIEQVLMNLAVNARDAMPDGGTLSISVETVSIGVEEAARHPDACVGNFVCLGVRDTGLGMDEQTLAHIFEPFFTTKDVGKGTGLGLATVYGIVRQHQGWIEVQSQPGQGTTFKVFFPTSQPEGDIQTEPEPGQRAGEQALAQSEVQKKTKPEPLPVVRGRGETVLVVEDEPALRHLVRRIIQGYGYAVIEAKSGVEALEVWRREKDQIHLLLTDIVMPEGISGRELARTLLAESPDLKIIFTSGYDSNPEEEAPVLIEGLNFLRKPYSPPALAKIMHRTLESEANPSLVVAA